MWLLEKVWEVFVRLLQDNRGFVDPDPDADPDPDPNADADADKDADADADKDADADADKDADADADADNQVTPEQLALFGGDEDLAKRFKGDPSGVAKAFRELQGKNKPVEMENAAVKGWAKKMGLEPIYNEEGSIVSYKPGESKQAQTRQRRFTDEHRTAVTKMFNTPEAGKAFIDAITMLIQDTSDDSIGAREALAYKAMEHQQGVSKAWAYSKKVWPSVDPDQEGFPEGGSQHFLLAQKIYNASEHYQKEQKGMLYAVAEAAAQLGIAPQKVAEAKKAGFEAGLGSRRILKRVSGPAGKGAGRIKVPGEPSMQEFIDMKPSERKKHIEAQAAKKNQGG